MHLFKDTYNFSEGVLNIGNGHCFLLLLFFFWGGGGASHGSPPFSKKNPDEHPEIT